MTKSEDEEKNPKELSCIAKFCLKCNDEGLKLSLFIMAVVALLVIAITIFGNQGIDGSENMRPILEQTHKKILISPEYTEGCKRIGCEVTCNNASDLFVQLHYLIEKSQCDSIDTILIQDQEFANSTLKNDWISTERNVKELIISHGFLGRIENEAFNIDDFTSTFSLTLENLRLRELSGGVLLGLTELKYLSMTGTVFNIDRVFFQPVQTSLIYLRLSGGVGSMHCDCIFGVSHLPNLEHLDLSGNNFLTPLTKKGFKSVPNVKYLILSNSKIMSIEEDAFEPIKNSLRLLDLSDNLLTTIDYQFDDILAMGHTYIYLAKNNWNCDCDIVPLIQLLNDHKDQIVDVPYCKTPREYYKSLVKQIELGDECQINKSSSILPPIFETTNSRPNFETTETQTQNEDETPKSTTSSTGEGFPSPSPHQYFQMRCTAPLDYEEITLRDLNQIEAKDLSDFFPLTPPYYEFSLIRLGNNSVLAKIDNYAGIKFNIIWFTDYSDGPLNRIITEERQINCIFQQTQSILIENLNVNSTYTFCLIPFGYTGISPFNCLPMYIPSLEIEEPDIWISNEDKQFTVGMICLIFVCSMLLGGVLAYFAIKTYPDLLEGSKHVFVVKKSDEQSYISTISDSKMFKTNSTKSKGSCFKCSLPPTPPVQRVLPIIPITSKIEDNDSGYEIAAHYEIDHDCALRCLPNPYATIPKSPPPLPKRNSMVSYETIKTPKQKRSI